MNKSKKPQRKKARQPKGGQYISIETASLAFAILLAGNNKDLLGRLFKLALRGPDIIQFAATLLLGYYGVNTELLMQGEPDTPATKDELVEVVRPVLKEGTRLVSFAQVFDLYLLRSQPTPESIVYVFYIIARYFVAKEQEPTKEQSQQIWAIAITIVRASNIGAKHLEELENKGEIYLKDWLDKVKENARKKFKTFLNQKQRMEKTADRTFESLYSFLFESDAKDERAS